MKQGIIPGLGLGLGLWLESGLGLCTENIERGERVDGIK
jgi:hypothetical protein